MLAVLRMVKGKKSMNDTDIIKALHRCSGFADCRGCPYPDGGDCIRRLCADALDLVERQSEELERVTARREKERRYFHNYLKKERLKSATDAVKKFAETVKTELYYEFDEIVPSYMADKIDKIAKEIMEKSHESQM